MQKLTYISTTVILLVFRKTSTENEGVEAYNLSFISINFKSKETGGMKKCLLGVADKLRNDANKNVFEAFTLLCWEKA